MSSELLIPEYYQTRGLLEFAPSNCRFCRTTLQAPDGIGLVPARCFATGTDNRRRVVAKCVPPLLSVLFSPFAVSRVKRKNSCTPRRLTAGLAAESLRGHAEVLQPQQPLRLWSTADRTSRSRSPLRQIASAVRIGWKRSLPRREKNANKRTLNRKEIIQRRRSICKRSIKIGKR